MAEAPDDTTAEETAGPPPGPENQPPKPRTIAEEVFDVASLISEVSERFRRVKPELALRILETSLNYKLARADRGLTPPPVGTGDLEDSSEEPLDAPA